MCTYDLGLELCQRADITKERETFQDEVAFGKRKAHTGVMCSGDMDVIWAVLDVCFAE